MRATIRISRFSRSLVGDEGLPAFNRTGGQADWWRPNMIFLTSRASGWLM